MGFKNVKQFPPSCKKMKHGLGKNKYAIITNAFNFRYHVFDATFRLVPRRLRQAWIFKINLPTHEAIKSTNNVSICNLIIEDYLRNPDGSIRAKSLSLAPITSVAYVGIRLF